MTEYIVLAESNGGYTKTHMRVDASDPEDAVTKALEKNPTWVTFSLWVVDREYLVRMFVETETRLSRVEPKSDLTVAD